MRNLKSWMEAIRVLSVSVETLKLRGLGTDHLIYLLVPSLFYPRTAELTFQQVYRVFLNTLYWRKSI